MNAGQKVIKYCAIAFALFLIVNIAGGIYAGILGVVFHTMGDENNSTWSSSSITIDFVKNFTGVKKLNIANGGYKLVLLTADTDKIIVEAENVPESFQAYMDSDTLYVKDKGNHGINFNWFTSDSSGTVTITIPRSYEFTEAIFEIGSGNARVAGINAESLLLDAGSGACEFDTCSAKNAKFSSGSGRVSLNNVNIGNLDYDAGSGGVSYEGNLTGKCEFDGGSGNIMLRLKGQKEDYSFDIDAGSGGCYINGDSVDEAKINYGTENEISIDGGSGKVEIDFVTE